MFVLSIVNVIILFKSIVFVRGYIPLACLRGLGVHIPAEAEEMDRFLSKSEYNTEADQAMLAQNHARARRALHDSIPHQRTASSLRHVHSSPMDIPISVSLSEVCSPR